MKELATRSISGIIGLFLLTIIVLKGGFILLLSIYLISLIGLREFYKAMEKKEIVPIYSIGYLWTTVLFINNLSIFDNLEIILTFTIIILLILTVIKQDIKTEDIGITILGMFYVPFLLSNISNLDGSIYIWLIFIISFGTDTFAYIAGNLFGKNKLSPNISPKKTVEGSIGGIMGSTLLAIIFALYFQLGSIWKIIILAITCSILSQLGDLVASKIKRSTGIKDFGNIMPGHGGVLDRFDSIIFTAPVIYYYVNSFLN